MTALEEPALDTLAMGCLGWLGDNLEFFNPFSGGSPAGHRPVKAALELALLCHCRTRLSPADAWLTQATTLVAMIWEHPDFLRHMAATPPDLARQYALIYAALAPAGIDTQPRAAALAALAAQDHLSPLGKSPYLRLEMRCYADKAGLAHAIESYEELTERSILVEQPSSFPMTNSDAYEITHTSFYVSDFGFRDPPLSDDARERAQSLLGKMLDDSVHSDAWDLVAELILAQFCLGGDPVRTSSGIAGIACLRRAQLPNGAIPGRSAALRPDEGASTAEFFWKSYHTTLVTALMSLIVAKTRWPQLSPAS